MFLFASGGERVNKTVSNFELIYNSFDEGTGFQTLTTVLCHFLCTEVQHIRFGGKIPLKTENVITVKA